MRGKKAFAAERKRRNNPAESTGIYGESDPYGTRTRVAGVKGRSPRPLDEGAVKWRCEGGIKGSHRHIVKWNGESLGRFFIPTALKGSRLKNCQAFAQT